VAKSLFRALAISVAIPIFGFLVAYAILADIDREYSSAEVPLLSELCPLKAVLSFGDLDAACGEYENIQLLRDGSALTGIVAIALILFYAVGAKLAGRNRALNAALFPTLIPLSLVVVSGMVIAQGAILTYGAYIGEAYAIERVHVYIIGAVAIGAIIASIKLISATFSLKGRLNMSVFGKTIGGDGHQPLIKFVDDIAARLSTKSPDNIVIGLDPNFFATAAVVNVLNENRALSGETLYLSAPLSRCFSKKELAAVIGHELGHFRGKDTAYSLKFAPAYSGLGKAIATLESGEEVGASAVAKIPAIAMLSLMYELFASNERSIGRERELEADKAGASVSSPEDMATALAKVAVFAPLWNVVHQSNIERLNEGKISRNLSQVFEDSTRFDVSKRDIGELVERILKTKISHPTDTHPTVKVRYDNLNFDAVGISADVLAKQGRSLHEIAPGLEEIEEELTLFEHKLMIALGAAEFPVDQDEKESHSFLNAMYALAATMIGADGKIEQEEVAAAERIGQSMFQGFDPVELRSFCNNSDSLPEFAKIIDVLGRMLHDEQKNGILGYLQKISEADKNVSEEETRLLDEVRRAWQIERVPAIG